MGTESIVSLRGFAKIAFALLLCSVCLCQGAGAQANTSVVATGPISAVAAHPATWGDVWETAISTNGDVVLGDFENGALYEFPAGGGALITLAAPGTWASGGWANMGVAIDPWNNLWIGDNWSANVVRIPYDSVNHTWNLADPNAITYSWHNIGVNPNYFQAGAIAISQAATNGTATFVVSAENVSALYSYTIDSSGNFSNGATVVTALKARARNLAIDPLGNIYLYEDGGLSGILEVPAGTTGLADDKALVRVDPAGSTPTGVATDVNGNVYVSDSVSGVYFVPNENGTPNPADAVVMAAVPADANVDFDLVHGIMYVPTTPGASGGWKSPNKTVYNDLVAIPFAGLSFGSGPTYTQGAAQTADFGFTSSETVASIEAVEPGASTPDFVIASGGTCTAGTTYAAGSSCTVNVALLSHTLGNVSAKIELLDANGNVLASMALSGLGLVPAVVSGPPTALATHPATWGYVWESAISSNGDLVLGDFQDGALYEFPAGGGALITLAATGTWGGGGWTNMGVAIDPWNNLWIGDNWNANVIRIPYDSVNHTWNLSDPNAITYTWHNMGVNPNYFQAGAIAFSSVVTKGTTTMVVSAENIPALYEYTVDSNGVFSNGTTVISAMKGRAKSLTIDVTGNIYLIEDGGLSGALRVPAGTTGLANDKALVRVDPALSNPAGVAVDASGNVYVGDSSDGIYLVPNENTTPNPSDAFLLTAAPAQANVTFDLARGIMYVPTTRGVAGGWNGINDIASVALSNVNLGSVAVGAQGTPASVNFGLGTGVNPGGFTIEEAGAKTPDFVIASGGSCTTGTPYAAQSLCSVNVALSPYAAGGVSAKLLMLDADKDTLASMTLYGVSQGAAIAVTPSLEVAIGSGLSTPSEVAADAAGNSYVADAGLKAVLMYPAGATATTPGVSVGSGLMAPTGVAVDGAGDVYIADSGSVYEVPNTPSGLNSAGQITVKGGLGTKLNLTVDGLGNLYIADPDNARVVKLINPGVTFGPATQIETDLTGFTAPTVVAIDESDNLYVVDSGKLIEVQPNGPQTTLLPTLGAATGLAIDPSGAVYAALSGGAVRIPFVSGALSPSTETTIATTVTNPGGLALDPSDNVYLSDGTALNIHMVSINGAVNTGSPALGSSGTASANVFDIGNSQLTVTGFSSSDAVDFSASGCTSPVAPGASCAVDVVMDPMGPGVQGPISSVITIASNAANSPVAIDASGTAAALASSQTTVTVASTATVLNVPVTVTVTAANGATGVPTGSVVISVDGVAQPAAALTNGTVVVTLAGFTAGNHTFSATYSGDRVFGTSTGTVTAGVGKGTVVMTLPAPPPYSLSTLDGAEPYDSSLVSYYTNYQVTVTGANGLMPTGVVAFLQGTSVQCSVNQSPDPLGTNLSASTKVPGSGQVTWNPGCLAISTNSNAPNEVTQQVISSVTYTGDANYQSTTGGPLTFEELRQPSVAISPNPGAVTVTSGTGSVTLNVTSVLGYGVSTNPAYPSSTPTLSLNNYTLPVGFACQGLPARATCTFTGGNYTDVNGVLHSDEVIVDTDPAKPVSIKVTVNTNVSAGTTTSKNSQPAPFQFAAMFGLGLIGLVFGRKSGVKGRVLMLLCLVIVSGALMGTTACSTKILGSSPILTTPAGSYAVIVTAQQVGSMTVIGTKGNPVLLYGSLNQMSLPYTLNVTVQ